MSTKPPRWVRRHVQVCRAAFGIGGVIEQCYVQAADEVAGNPACGGETVTTPRYHRAAVTFRRDMAPDARGYETVTHELLHAAMPRQAEAVHRIIDLLPPDLRDHAWACWADANEATVTQLARGLTPLLCEVAS